MHLNSSDLTAAPAAYPRRFSWKMRLFLSFFIFAITFRSLSVLVPMEEWASAYDMGTAPQRLPTQAERKKLSENASKENPYPVLASCMGTADSMWDFWRPWPNRKSRQHILSTADGLKWTATWLNFRLKHCESLLAISEWWGMYAPGVDLSKTHTRARLFYDDGSDIVIRQTAEPADYTHFGHWLEERVVNYELSVRPEWHGTNEAYCNYLAQKYAHNASGARLLHIVLFNVEVVLARPRVDALAHYRQQNSLTEDPPRLPGEFRSGSGRADGQVSPDFYEFNVVAWQGRNITHPNP